MKDVDHTPPTGESVSNVWDRGGEVAPDEEAAADGAVPADD